MSFGFSCRLPLLSPNLDLKYPGMRQMTIWLVTQVTAEQKIPAHTELSLAALMPSRLLDSHMFVTCYLPHFACHFGQKCSLNINKCKFKIFCVKQYTHITIYL